MVVVWSPTLSPPESLVEQFEFNLSGFTISTTKLTSPKNKNCKKRGASASDSKMKQPTGISQLSLRSGSTISDLKDLASSKLDSSRSEIMKDVEASLYRLQKRFKLQKQAYQQVMDEAEKEHKKMSERINEGRDAMKGSYVEFLEAAQASASRLLKTSIPELSQSFGNLLIHSRVAMGSHQLRLDRRSFHPLLHKESCHQQVMDEAEKEYKLSERINEDRDAMKCGFIFSQKIITIGR